MKEHDIKFAAIPSTEEVKAERERLAYRSRYTRVLRSTIYALVVVAAVAVLLATLFLPVLQVSGDSMNPTLQDKDVIVLVKSGSLKTGDLCGFTGRTSSCSSGSSACRAISSRWMKTAWSP